MFPLELWLGIEATVNRTDSEYQDQMVLSSVHERMGDLERIASTGAKRVRFPVLWERVAPDSLEDLDWGWTDSRLRGLRDLGVDPIAGLLHHGSGPRYTDLLDPHFPQKLAQYAGAVARRYPWLTHYTPVNEPLTTARFSALYGLWYPHARDVASFLRTLVHQLRGTQLAMQAIREVNSSAQLVQTEDLGFTRSTYKLRYQADFDNLRRWLSLDLLCGRVDSRHELWAYLLEHGLTERDLTPFLERPCPPDIVGINTYVTSERFLDGRLEHHNPDQHGGNGRDGYVDLETVRVFGGGVGGFAARLREAHERYALPLALTEVHLGCTREEQMRWLLEAYRAALELRAEGADVRALTLWSAFGAFEWNSLLTRQEGHYESGLWDVRAPEPRATALVSMAQHIARGETPQHPVLETRGWWHRPERFSHPPFGPVRSSAVEGRPILIYGPDNALSQAFARVCRWRGLAFVLEHELTDLNAVLEQENPWAVVDVSMDSNPAALVQACFERSLKLLSFSSAAVFDGKKGSPYLESDLPNPSSLQGKRALERETLVLEALPQTLLIRTRDLFGPWDLENPVQAALEAVRSGQPLTLKNLPASWAKRHLSGLPASWAKRHVLSRTGTEGPARLSGLPAYLPDVVQTSLELLIDDEKGVWHLSNPGPSSFEEFIQALGGAVNSSTTQMPFTVLSSERAWMMPSFINALERYRDALHRDEIRALEVSRV